MKKEQKMKTEQKINYKRFNKLISSFLSDLKKALPEEKKLKVVSSQIETLILLTPKKIFKSCVDFVYPYKQQILSKDEKFFLGDNVTIKDVHLAVAVELKTLWTTQLSPQKKKLYGNILKY